MNSLKDLEHLQDLIRNHPKGVDNLIIDMFNEGRLSPNHVAYPHVKHSVFGMLLRACRSRVVNIVLRMFKDIDWKLALGGRYAKSPFMYCNLRTIVRRAPLSELYRIDFLSMNNWNPDLVEALLRRKADLFQFSPNPVARFCEECEGSLEGVLERLCSRYPMNHPLEGQTPLQILERRHAWFTKHDSCNLTGFCVELGLEELRRILRGTPDSPSHDDTLEIPE